MVQVKDSVGYSDWPSSMRDINGISPTLDGLLPSSQLLPRCICMLDYSMMIDKIYERSVACL